MPSLAEPFDGVLTEKDWSKARDKTGLTGSLTEKVSMGKELTLFHKTKDEAAATHLLGKIAIYEQVLKAKHSKDKYYANLLKLVTAQQQAVQLGITILKNAPIITDVRKRLQKITAERTALANRIEDVTQTKASEKAFKDRYEAFAVRVRELLKEVPEGAFVLNPTAVEGVVHLEKDWQTFQDDLKKEATADDDDDDEGGATTPAGKYWEQTMIPYITGLINAVLSKNPDLILKAQPAQIIGGLMGAVRTEFERTYDVYKIKPFSKDHRPDPKDATTVKAVDSAGTILLQAAKTATTNKADTEWFRYAPIPENPKTGGGSEKKIAFTGTAPEEFDEQKAYGSLLMKLSALAADPAGGAKLLSNTDLLKMIFPYEIAVGRKETDPSQKKSSTVSALAELGQALTNGVTDVRRSLQQQPPGIDAARTTLSQLHHAVDGLQLARHGETVQKGVKLFVLKPLEDEIAAAGRK